MGKSHFEEWLDTLLVILSYWQAMYTVSALFSRVYIVHFLTHLIIDLLRLFCASKMPLLLACDM